MKKAAVLIHGLLMSSSIMKKLGNKMRRSGFTIYYFNYQSSKYSDNTLVELKKLIRNIHEQEIYFVGHSMGGLVARNYVTAYPESALKGIVTIATPHNRSRAADVVERTIFKRFIGSAGISGLTKDLPEWEMPIPLGCIAGVSTGKLSKNLFLMMTKRHAPSDGTVFIDEAIAPRCTDSIVIPGSHTGLVFQNAVAEQCVYFCEQKKFRK